MYKKLANKFALLKAVVVVKWSEWLPSTPTIRVQVPMNYTVFSGKFVFEKNENKQKEAGVRPLFFFKKNSTLFFFKKTLSIVQSKLSNIGLAQV